MGRKWTNIKFQFEDRNGKVQEASHSPRSQEEVVQNYIREEWEEENIPGIKNIDVMFGNLYGDKLDRYMEKFFEKFEFLQEAVAVHVTDSANCGYGYYYERVNGSVERVEEYTGIENCYGNDVADEISNEHYISVNPDWFW